MKLLSHTNNEESDPDSSRKATFEARADLLFEPLMTSQLTLKPIARGVNARRFLNDPVALVYAKALELDAPGRAVRYDVPAPVGAVVLFDRRDVLAVLALPIQTNLNALPQLRSFGRRARLLARNDRVGRCCGRRFRDCRGRRGVLGRS